MKTKPVGYGAAAFLFLGLFISYSGPAQALPNHPEKCTPGYDSTPEAKRCLSVVNPGVVQPVVICTNDGDVLCCWKNVSGGYDCNQINALTSPLGGGVRVPGDRLQIAPETSSPSTSTSPKAPTSPMIRRRGVEGEQPSEPAPGTSVPPEQTVPEQPSGTKPQ